MRGNVTLRQGLHLIGKAWAMIAIEGFSRSQSLYPSLTDGLLKTRWRQVKLWGQAELTCELILLSILGRWQGFRWKKMRPEIGETHPNQFFNRVCRFAFERRARDHSRIVVAYP
jgi:hypothetical protein